MSDQSLPEFPLPSGWAKSVKSAVLHVISLAHFAIVAARGWAANSINARVRLSGENDQVKQEDQLLREELRIKDVRMAKIDPRHRPHYPAIERLAILELKAARPQRPQELPNRLRTKVDGPEPPFLRMMSGCQR